MRSNRMLAAGVALTLALPGAALAQMAGNGAAEEDEPAHGGMMMQGEMMPEGMRERIEQMMRPMMQEMMREMMGQTEMEEAAPSDAAPSADQDAHHPAGGDQAAGSPATDA